MFSRDGGYVLVNQSDSSNEILEMISVDGNERISLIGPDTQYIVPDLQDRTDIESISASEISRAIFSPSGDRVVFDAMFTVTFTDGSQKYFRMIYSVRTDGTELIPLTDLTTSNDYHFPSFTPDGKSIIYYAYYGSEQDNQICIMDSDGEQSEVLTNNFAEPQRWYSLSPDGTEIVYAGPDNAMYIMNLEDSYCRLLTDKGQSTDCYGISSLDFMPDGTRVVFSLDYVEASGRVHPVIFSINTDGTDLIQLTKTHNTSIIEDITKRG